MLTQKESAFLINLLSQVSVKAADPTSVETVAMIQSIVTKLKVENVDQPSDSTK